jgi:putative component of membrane protein insertase Oxa1/YidC/SpoIIIJ protein YidD
MKKLLKNFKIFICFFPVFLTGNFISAQNINDIKLLENIFENKKTSPEYKNLVKNNSNEIQWIASGLLIGYKTILSSQDGNRCVFYPSCSVYALESIKKKGMFLGFAAAMDRLSRCNRLSPENYTIYEKTNLLFDPVK